MQDIPFAGTFVTSREQLTQKLSGIKAFVFDWDGVFNDGQKDISGSSTFSEVDAMGTNLLRFNHFLTHQQLPVTAVISGEKNEISFSFARREHFHAVYFGIKHKIQALEHFCAQHKLQASEIAFIFDDVLDFSIAEVAGLRIMIGRSSTLLLQEFAKKNNLVDYITGSDGGAHGLRESAELLMGLSGNYSDTIEHRMRSSELYKTYLSSRNEAETVLFGPGEIG
ncbi:MAG: hypothetical protein J0M30_08005 [Chitinophagales bacterium]|nr:hypothetical protein [Chitinophagales bacterium]